MIRKTSVIAALSLAASSLAAQAPSAPAPSTVVLRAARMITIASPEVVQNAAVVVTGERIVAAGPSRSVAIPAGARIIDLGDVTLLPGFIDTHTHIVGRTLGDQGGEVASVRD